MKPESKTGTEKPEPVNGGNQTPNHGSRCVDVLSDTLEGFAGIQKAEFNLDDGKLKIEFDPRVLSHEHALRLVQISGQKASNKVARCMAKGPEACAFCTGELGVELKHHYKQLAYLDGPITEFKQNGRTGTILVNLEAANLQKQEGTQLAADRAGQRGPSGASQRSRRDRIEVLLTLLTVVFSGLALASPQFGVQSLVTWILWGVAYATGGYFGFLDGLATLRERRLDVNLLMILAALGAAVIGQPFEGAVLLFLFSLSNTLQSYAIDRSRKAIEKLLDLRPAKATVRHGSRLVVVDVEKLQLGDVVIVRPGERFPIDGQVISGTSDVNQAPITGESMPVHKSKDESVFAGTVNGTGALEIRVTRLAQDTTLARIVQMVEDAQNSKARTQRLLDDFEQVYALVIIAVAALLVVIPYFFFQQDFHPTFYRAMTWLVVASPCALVISTPASILSAIANGARHGILYKGGIHLETSATLKVVAFDKTGTLTEGKPKVTAILPINGVSESDLLRRVASLEARSEHPLAAAIVSAAHEQGLSLLTAAGFRAIPGQGVEGRLEDEWYWVGARRLYVERGISIPEEVARKASELEENGMTVILAYQPGEPQGKWLGIIGAADVVRPDARDMVINLKRQGIDRVVMLTGDNQRVAARIAALTGVDEYHADLLPEDKVALLKTLRSQYGPVAMVGDGVNDAPALASADVGIAMGGAGTDVAMETADLVLISDDLKKLPHAVGLARRARKIVWQNISFSLAVIVLLIITTFWAQLPLPLGVVGHEGSTVLVVLNGLRLLTYRL